MNTLLLISVLSALLYLSLFGAGFIATMMILRLVRYWIRKPKKEKPPKIAIGDEFEAWRQQDFP